MRLRANESRPRALETIHLLLKGKVTQFFSYIFFKIKKQGEKVEVLKEENRMEVMFVR